MGLVLAIFLSQCGGGSTVSGSGSSSTNTTDDVVGGNVSAISLTEGSSEITFTDLTSSEDIVVALHTYNANNTAEGFSVGSSENTRFLETDDLSDELVADEGDPTESFHMMLRDVESEINEDAALPESSRYLTRYATTGSTRTFKVLNSFSSSTSYDTVTATLRYQNAYFEFYVDDRDVSSLSDSDLQTLADDFLDVLSSERQLFGTESDVNNDDKFAVLFTHTVNGLASGSGGIVTGFFYAVDLFDSSDYPLSNEMEVFYSFVPDPDGDYGSAVSKSFSMSNILPGVLVHEYQHMINFNQHYFVNGGSAEQGFLNEGLSHLAEDIYSVNENNYMTTTGIENPARVKGFLENISNICFSCGSSLNQRGGSYLFLRYLYEQAQLGNLSEPSSGAALIGDLLDTNLRGIDNIVNAVYGSSAPDDAFRMLLGHFSLAVYLSNTGETDDDQLEFTGINLRGAQDDNRGTVLNGPAVQEVTGFPFTDTIQGSSMQYLQISGSVINANGGVIPLSVSTDADFGGYVIR